jgi:hypothetical protein
MTSWAFHFIYTRYAYAMPTQALADMAVFVVQANYTINIIL